ncbi:unnamed protein product [Caenorhabditis auriculariae]|uniref:Uncharacterized protein n=1 Tax=Caenorhabditis auriculariae TaxID=2777116 RepID=A0A8S1HDE5_9PELO|nr:unnamed protein product [Caenorhabditis auriculariae]
MVSAISVFRSERPLWRSEQVVCSALTRCRLDPWKAENRLYSRNQSSTRQLSVRQTPISAVMSVSALPNSVKNLFPEENLKFAESITESEAKVLREAFQKHGCFEECGEMISHVREKSPELARRMQEVLEANKNRLSGLTPEAIAYSKRVICMVTRILCNLTLGKPVDESEANRITEDFKKLCDSDRLGMQNNNPDIKFQ